MRAPIIGNALLAAALAATMLTGGCNTLRRLSEVGKEPAMAPIENPTRVAGYRPVSMPMPAPQPLEKNPASLWRPGAKAFFKDIRAKEVGDILTVKLKLDDKAKMENTTDRARDDSEKAKVNTIFGYDNPITKVLKDATNGSTFLDFGSKSDTEGDGQIDRSEKIEIEVAAVVTQVLPNGNLAIVGRQEVRVNYELRQLMVVGVVRPQDIEADNTISHEKIAEMRMAYGGRGTLSDLQQPRWGTQVWDILFPF